MENDTVLTLRNVTKRFGEIVAVDHLDIPYIKRGEFVTFLGPSGCGKTTLLRMIGGFYYPTEGDIIMHGERINDIPPEKRKTSMVFQNYALFPHMSVFDNIAYGLRLRKFSKSKIEENVKNILSIVQLEGLENRRPNELSGGQQQRVALARSIVLRPELILLDEPLSNLDASLRVMMREEIRKIQQSLNLTTIFVTHDQEEAMSMSDRIVVMNKGRIEQIGTPTEIYERPETLFVAGFIGYINMVQGRVRTADGRHCSIDTEVGELVTAAESAVALKAGDRVTAIIRPESAAIEKKHKAAAHNAIAGVVQNVTYIGSIARYRCAVQGRKEPFIVDVSDPLGRGMYEKGEDVTIIVPEKFHCIRGQS